MSDFLQIEDEVINGTPKYNITSNGDGTSSITLANEVVHSGTPLNKATLDPINNIIGYNILDYEQQIITSGISTTTSSGRYESKQIIPNSKNYEIYFDTAAISGTNVYGGGIRISTNSDILYVPSYISSFFVKAYDNNEVRLEGSNDKVNWTSLGNVYKAGKTISNNYRYYRNNYNYGYGLVNDFDGVISSTEYSYNKPINKNKMALKVFIDIEEASSDNTLNGKPIDTLLQNNKYYELLYDEPNDRFIAHEERV